MSQLHSSLHRHHAVLEGAHRYFAVAAVHGPPAGDGPHAAGERVGGRPGGRPGGKAGGRFSPAAAHARSDDAREAAAPAMGMSAAMWEGFADELGLHAFLLPRGEGGSEQGEERSEAARRVHAQVRQTMEGCNPLPKRLQPCASEAAIHGKAAPQVLYWRDMRAHRATSPSRSPTESSLLSLAEFIQVQPRLCAPAAAPLHPCSRASARALRLQSTAASTAHELQPLAEGGGPARAGAAACRVQQTASGGGGAELSRTGAWGERSGGAHHLRRPARAHGGPAGAARSTLPPARCARLPARPVVLACATRGSRHPPPPAHAPLPPRLRPLRWPPR